MQGELVTTSATLQVAKGCLLPNVTILSDISVTFGHPRLQCRNVGSPICRILLRGYMTKLNKARRSISELQSQYRVIGSGVDARQPEYVCPDS